MDKTEAMTVRQMVLKAKQSYIQESLQFLSSYMIPEKFQGLYVSFNGGKDATAALFLTLMAIENSSMAGTPVKCLYFTEPNSFEEVNQFISFIRRKYSLLWFQLKSKNYSEQLTKFSLEHPLQFIVMGTRKDDPHCQHLSSASPSDTQKGYPPFIRLNPLINWNYQEVWTFIKGLGLPYCKLYDVGYTYLGNKDNTVKNKELYDKETKTYKPACEAQSHLEQKSRGSLLSK